MRVRTGPPTARLRWLIIGLALGLVAVACSAPDPDDQPGPTPDTVEVEIYLANDQLGDPCGEVFPVTRQVDADHVVTATLHALLAGPTPTEQAQGYGGWFTADTAHMLLHVEVIDHTVHVTFADLREVIPAASSSCGSAGLLAQLDTTLLALDGIDATRYTLADLDAFYTWLQLPTPDRPEPQERTEPQEPETTAAVQLLVADADGIRIVGDGGEMIWFLTTEASLATPDRSGGVVYQGPRHLPTGLRWDEELGRNAYVWEEGGPDPIWRIVAPGEETEPIISHADAMLDLVDVATVDGRPTVVYRMTIGGPGAWSSWDMVETWLYRYDLISGTTAPLGLVGSFESDVFAFRFGGDLVAVTHDPYGGLRYTTVGVLPLATIRSVAEGGWLPPLVVDHLRYGPGLECDRGWNCEGWAQATVASDGSRLSWVQRVWSLPGEESPPDVRPAELVTVDPASGRELMRITVEEASEGIAGVDWQARFIDDDGTFVVISGVGTDDEIALIGPQGDVVMLELTGATASIWQSSP
jgi:hypothetical protein